MITVSGFSKTYGGTTLFDEAGFSINEGERIGLVGRNGHGKTTLIKILAGMEESDSGSVLIPRGYTIGYLQQVLKFDQKSILEFVCAGLRNQDEHIDESYKAKAILLGLGFNEAQFDLHPDTLSGGYQVRLNLAKLLVSEPNLLLLDEPTNYLDILSMRWLSGFLRNWSGELMFITHDRDFMDNITTHTLGIHRQKIVKIEGPTSKYYELIAVQEELYEKTRQGQLKRREETEAFINRFRAQASKAKTVQSRVKALEKDVVLEELSDISSLDFKFPYQEFKGKWPLHTKNLSFSYPQSDLELISNLSFSLKTDDRIGIIGKNGKGKSTLLKLLANELTPTSGSVEYSSNTVVQYFGQTNVDRLNPDFTIEEEIQNVAPLMSRTVIRTICGLVMFSGDLAEKKIKVLSGGERARVLLGKLLLQPGNLLLLDEPTNHLDMESNEALLEAIKSYAGTVLFVTHNEHFLNELANRLIIFDRGNVEYFEGGYADFLRTRGWEDEGPLKSDKPKSSGNNRNYSKKELRQLRAEINLRKSKELKPLTLKMTDLEQQIVKMEQQVAEETKSLNAISVNGFNEEASKLSRSVSQTKKRIEDLFAEFEQISSQHQALDQELQQQLDSLKG